MKNETEKIPIEVPLRTSIEVPVNTQKKAPLVDPKASLKKIKPKSQ